MYTYLLSESKKNLIIVVEFRRIGSENEGRKKSGKSGAPGRGPTPQFQKDHHRGAEQSQTSVLAVIS